MMKELVIEADRMNLPEVQMFIDEQLEEAGCPMATQIAIDVAVEEIFVNIASYAYGEEGGNAVIQVTMHEEPLSVEITFIDSGAQYDPLAKADPDTTLSAKERKKVVWVSICSRIPWTKFATNTRTERISLP